MTNPRLKRGLMLQLAGLGDLIMALPSIDELLQAYPDTEWTMLTRPEQAELLLDRDIRVKTMHWPPDATCFVQQVSTIWQLRQCHFDLVINLYSLGSKKGEWAIRSLLFIIGAGLSLGRVSDGKLVYDINWDESQAFAKHEIDLNLGLISMLGVQATQNIPVVKVSEKSLRQVKKYLVSKFSRSEKFAVVFAGGARRTRYWGIEKYSELIKYLLSLDLKVCIVGGESQSEDASQMTNDLESVANFTGQLSLQDLSALIQQSTIYIGNDSGPSHLAAAVGTPTVVIFGPGDVERYCPRGKSEIRVARFAMDCSPCYLESCSHHSCMHFLTFDMVKKHVDAIVLDGKFCKHDT